MGREFCDTCLKDVTGTEHFVVDGDGVRRGHLNLAPYASLHYCNLKCFKDALDKKYAQ